MFQKKQEVIDIVPENQAPVSIQEAQKGALTEEMIRQVALTLNLDREEKDSYTRNEEVISPAVTRFIDLFDKDERTGKFQIREDEFQNPLDIMGALGNIPAHQMQYIQFSNFNNIWFQLREGIYLDVYDTDSDGQLKLDKSGEPILKYTRVINIGAFNKKLQLLANLAYEQNRAKLEGQVMVGQSGGQPLGVGGSWDDTLSLLFGGGNRKK